MGYNCKKIYKLIQDIADMNLKCKFSKNRPKNISPGALIMQCPLSLFFLSGIALKEKRTAITFGLYCKTLK